MRQPSRLSPEELAPYLVATPSARTLAEAKEPLPVLAWPALFGNEHPVEIEVGFGKGLFLLNASEAHPEVNFFGVEIERKYVYFTATRLAKRQRSNVKVAQGDARLFLRDRIAEGSVQAVHVYFPDPWWKKRHHKRRVFTEDFVRQCARILKPQGRFHIVTDVEEYHQIIQALVTEVALFTPLAAPEPGQPAHELDYLTNFERKFRLEGRPIYRSAYLRHPSPPST